MGEEYEEFGNNINGGSFELVSAEKETAVSSTSRRSLCFKLKIPKSELTTTVQDPTPTAKEEEEEEVLPFACPVCEKRFKSGKALGGHKRMHNINKKKQPSTHPNKAHHKGAPLDDHDQDQDRNEAEDDDEEEEGGGDGAVVVCGLCSKSFQSKKSLFGHMRSHPERGWRGIHPPTPYNNSCSAEAQQNSSASLPGWSVTAKRGRKSVTSSAASASTDSAAASSSTALDLQVVIPGMEESMKEAVLDLMLLAHHKPPGATVPSNKLAQLGDDDDDDDNCYSDNWAALGGDNDPQNSSEDSEDDEKIMVMAKKRKRKMKLVDRLRKDDEYDEDKAEDEDEDDELIQRSSSKQKKKTVKKAAVASSTIISTSTTTSSSQNKYVCSACNKSFSSYQALGGHRSSHNKSNHPHPKPTVKNHLNFDLNEPPPPEDDHE